MLKTMPLGNGRKIFVYSAMKSTFMRKALLVLLACFHALARSLQLKVSDNQRYLLGDTAWELFRRLSLQDADHYLKHPAEQGFTVIQVVCPRNLTASMRPMRTVICP